MPAGHRDSGVPSALVEARASVLAFEAGRTIVLDREALSKKLDEHGIAIIGIRSESEAPE